MIYIYYIPELYLIIHIITGLIYTIIHSKRFGINITTYNIKVLFTMVSIFIIYLKLSYNPDTINILEWLYVYIVLLTTIILWIIDLRKIDETYYYMISMLASLLLIQSINLITIYIFIELLSFTSYLLASIGSVYITGGHLVAPSHKDNHNRIEASVNYFILGSIFSTILLLGILLLYISTGETNLYNISLLMAHHYINTSQSWGTYGSILIILSILFKLGVSPFSLWVPSIYYGASSKVSIYLSTATKLPLIYILYICVQNIGYTINESSNIITTIISICSILSLLIGSISALNVTNLKSIIAFSSINSLGYILIPLLFKPSSGHGDIGMEIILMYLYIYIISTISLWIIIISTNTYNIISLKSLLYTNKYICYSLLFILFSLTGLPPFIGFLPKLYLFIYSYNNELYLITLIAILTSIISTFYYIRLITILLFSPYNIKSSIVSILQSYVPSSMVPYNLSYINSYILGSITYITLFGLLILA